MKWYVITGIAVAGSAVVVGLGYYFLKPRRNDEGDPESRFTGNGQQDNTTPEVSVRYNAPQTNPAPVTSSGFPIKRGSRNEYVRTLQTAIIKDFTKDGYKPLPKYGADGDWGSETQKFFTDHPKLKSVLDQTTYTDYITGNWPADSGANSSSSSSSPTPKTTASTVSNDIKNLLVPSWIVDPKVAIGYKIFDSAKAKNLQNTLSLLKQLSNVADYTSASQGFQLRFWKTEMVSTLLATIPHPVRFTLVNGLLDAFTVPSDKTLLRAEFKRMGLKETVKNSDPANYDSSWSLSGLGRANKNVRTNMRAIISDGFNVRVEVPSRTLLGQWLSSGNGYTRFRTPDGRDMYVRSNAIVFA